jgi:peptidoglycan/LPS O-acetylase OafA/YrhL
LLPRAERLKKYKLPERKESWRIHVIASNSVATPTTSRFYRPELDVLRFVAFLMVYLTHTIPDTPGSPRWVLALSNATGFGVQVFFVLSAYLITELLTREKRVTGRLNAKAFYARRILRIWPLYFFALGAGFLFSRLHPAGAISVHALVAYLFLAGNWYTSRYGYLAFAIGPLWTISVEEQFYLAWPLLVRYLTRRNIAVVCCAGWAASQIVLICLCARHALFEPTIWTNTLVQLQYFALGAGVSLFLNGSAPRIRGSLRGLLIASAFLLLFAADLVLNPDRADGLTSVAHTYPEMLLVGAAVTLMLVGFLNWSVFNGWRSIRYLGKISYGLYVYHLPCLTIISKIFVRSMGHDSPLADFALGLPLTIGIAAISYRYFESPFLRMKERFEIVKTRAV